MDIYLSIGLAIGLALGVGIASEPKTRLSNLEKLVKNNEIVVTSKNGKVLRMQELLNLLSKNK